ncbi:MAG: methyltransferase domain-containing protein [Gammaproteobacteria bacterium]|nr:methyltransferase domain-containing protein [Gammaproteobacteria bacterium]
MKLHLGCGSKYIEGFVHVDIMQHDHVDHIAKVDNLPFDDNSADLIYASHVLEHFGRNEFQNVLKEWHRVLKVGGILRVAVPDFQAVAELYCAGKLPNGLIQVMGLVCGGQRNEWDYHKVIFDKVFLTQNLEHIGFHSIVEYDWHKTEHAHLDDYSQAYIPHLDKENGRLMSLNLEAVKR